MKIIRNPNEKSDAVLFLQNLAPPLTTAALEGMFCKFGTVLSCMVADQNGKSNGFGYIQFGSHDSAISALNALHGTVFQRKTLCLSKFQSKTERKGDCMESQFTNLYVKNLPELFTEDSLREKFSKCGKVFNVAIMKDGEGKSKGFGFVNFESHEDAKKAIETLNGAPIGLKKLYVGKAQKKAEREELLKRAREEKKVTGGVNLYVKNLDISIDDSKLEEIFSAYGKVSSVKVMRNNNNGVSKGFGFVSFSSEEVGMKALKLLHGRFVQGRFMYVGVAQRKEERVRELQTRFSTYDNFYDRGMFQQYYNFNYHLPFPHPNPLVLPNYLYPPTGYHPVYTCAPTRPPTQIPVRPSSQGRVNTTGWVYQQKHPIRYVGTMKQKRFCCKSVKVESKRINNEKAGAVPTRYQHVYACTPTQIPVSPSLNQRTTSSDWVHQQKHPMRYIATSKQQSVWCKSVKVESKRISNGGAADAEPPSSERGLGGQATKIGELLLELEKSKIQKILDNPQYLAMEVMKATAQAKCAPNPCACQAQAVHYPH